MADKYDLNAIRDSFLASQAEGSDGPRSGRDQVYVDRGGRVRLGTGDEKDAPLSKVPHSTFASRLRPIREGTPTRLAEERRVAERKLPPGTYYEETPGAEGWVYEITTEFHNSYVMCAHFDGVDYKVRLLEPELESLPDHDQHGFHLYNSGKICLSRNPGSGMPTLEEAYARSAAWALGVDFVRMGHPFPFNRDQ
ncbi:hypothetical protein [Streptomyces alkaliterrae]|uniref:Uncharacterized protein n=1 Tax=Streptomyces alkaliterrae TaxID=2213162 RepID=A0A5P0YRH8_9ACTN|nr:hypothetical protein [Streptomyces alkaliterrae]MBB1252168.1 hypothetical protein [Streptomyces alkaliterrae]MBB1258562.1 hypothetical protein [Streptomyces alkaliterrae]MQS02931.1 hypothetical protein [Streptomyces alkaliterrae]